MTIQFFWDPSNLDVMIVLRNKNFVMFMFVKGSFLYLDQTGYGTFSPSRSNKPVRGSRLDPDSIFFNLRFWTILSFIWENQRCNVYCSLILTLIVKLKLFFWKIIINTRDVVRAFAPSQFHLDSSIVFDIFF
jgi:hypothetical protein